jgi:hypothetical protein
VLRTDGTNTAAGGVSTVSWTPKAGKVTTFSATAQYAPGRIHTWSFWAAVLGGGGVVIALFVVCLALLARRRNIRKEAKEAAYN